MYTVIHEFLDLKDELYHYRVGDKFPRAGKRPSKARIAELSTADNKIGVPLIEEIKKQNKKG